MIYILFYFSVAKIINVVKVNASGDPENPVRDIAISPEPVVTWFRFLHHRVIMSLMFIVCHSTW